MTKDIFFSYGHDEYIDYVLSVKDFLTEKGFDVFIDSEQLYTAKDWEYKLEEGIKKSDKIVFFITPHSVRRPDSYCLKELSFASYFKKQIIPIMLEHSPPPINVSNLQFLDMQPFRKKDKIKEFSAKLYGVLQNSQDLDSDGLYFNMYAQLKPIDFEVDLRRHKRIIGRRWILDEVNHWMEKYEKSNVLWISAESGYGKSAIATLLAEEHPDVKAIHFCSEDGEDYNNKNDPENFIRTIAYMLQTQIDGYFELIKDIALDGRNINWLFEELISRPLTKLNKENRNYIIVISGLSGAIYEGKNKIAMLIRDNFRDLPSYVKMIIVSGDDDKLTKYLSSFHHIKLDRDSRNRQDCIDFIQSQLQPRDNNNINNTTFTHSLLQASGENIHYIKSFFMGVEEGNMSMDSPNEFPTDLKAYYGRYFDNLDGDKERQILTLEVMLAFNEPIPKSILHTILNIPEYELDPIITQLGSIIIESEEKIKFENKSIKSWVSEDAKQYQIYEPRGKESLESFLSKISFNNYKQEYLKYTNFNIKLITYMLQIDKDISDYLSMINQFNNEENKISLLLKLTSHFSIHQKYNLSIEIGIILVEILKSLFSADETWKEKYFQSRINLADANSRKKTKNSISESIRLYGELLDDLKSDNVLDANIRDKLYTSVLISLAYQLKDIGSIDESIALETECKEILEKKIENKDDDEFVEFGEKYAKILNALAYTYSKYRNDGEVFVYREKAVEIMKILFRRSSRYTGYYATVLSSLAYNYGQINNIKECIKNEEEAYNLRKELYDDDKDRWTNIYAKSLNSLNYAYRKNNSIDIAIERGEESVRVRKELYYDKNNKHIATDYVSSLRNLADSYELIYFINKTLTLKDEAQSIVKEMYDDDNNEKNSEAYIKVLLSQLETYKKIKDYDKAMDIIKDLLDLIEPLFNNDKDRWSHYYIVSLIDIAIINHFSPDISNYDALEEGEKALKLSIKYYYKAETANNLSNTQIDDHTKCLSNLALIYAENKNFNKALILEYDSHEILKKLYDEHNDRWADRYIKSLINLSMYYFYNNKEKKSLDTVDETTEILDKLYARNNNIVWLDSYIKNLINQTILFDNMGLHQDAIEKGTKAKKIMQSYFDNNGKRWVDNYIDICHNLAIAYRSYNLEKTVELRNEIVDIVENFYNKSNELSIWKNRYRDALIDLNNVCMNDEETYLSLIEETEEKLSKVYL